MGKYRKTNNYELYLSAIGYMDVNWLSWLSAVQRGWSLWRGQYTVDSQTNCCWNVMSCSSIDMYRTLKAIYCLLHLDRWKSYLGYGGRMSIRKFSMYRGADKSLARPTSRSILFDCENISFDASLVLYIYIVPIFLQLWL